MADCPWQDSRRGLCQRCRGEGGDSRPRRAQSVAGALYLRALETWEPKSQDVERPRSDGRGGHRWLMRCRESESSGPSMSARAAGRMFYRDALEHNAIIHEVRVLAVGLPTRHPLEVYRLWFWMACALLVENSRAPRPRLPLAVIDGEDASFRRAHDLVAHRFYHAFPRCQPYVGKGAQWFVGGSVHQESHLHPFVQMADLVAGAARHSIVGRKQVGSWYGKHLAGKQPIDVSSQALSQIKRRSRGRRLRQWLGRRATRLI